MFQYKYRCRQAVIIRSQAGDRTKSSKGDKKCQQEIRTSVGSRLGSDVACRPVGELEGVEVGLGVGLSVGASVGDSVGDSVDGGIDGSTVGSAVG